MQIESGNAFGGTSAFQQPFFTTAVATSGAIQSAFGVGSSFGRSVPASTAFRSMDISQNPLRHDLNSTSTQFRQNSGTLQSRNSVPRASKSVQACRNFLQTGHCDRGDTCHFLHDIPQATGQQSRPSQHHNTSVSSPGFGDRSQIPCRYAASGHCQKADCPFAHDVPSRHTQTNRR